jgi:hypothetical protein
MLRAVGGLRKARLLRPVLAEVFPLAAVVDLGLALDDFADFVDELFAEDDFLAEAEAGFAVFFAFAFAPELAGEAAARLFADQRRQVKIAATR